jgi:hypothetical protein
LQGIASAARSPGEHHKSEFVILANDSERITLIVIRIDTSDNITKKIDDLYDAYIFAQKHALTEDNLKSAHKFLCRNILPSAFQGQYRHQNMYVATDDGRIEYVAVEPQLVKREMSRFFQDVFFLLNTSLSLEEVFYFAAAIHLVFVKRVYFILNALFNIFF